MDKFELLNINEKIHVIKLIKGINKYKGFLDYSGFLSLLSTTRKKRLIFQFNFSLELVHFQLRGYYEPEFYWYKRSAGFVAF